MANSARADYHPAMSRHAPRTSQLAVLALLAAACSGPPASLRPALDPVEPPPVLQAPEAPAARAAAVADEVSVKPGINDRFLSGGFSVEDALSVFEVESREIALHRDAIAAALELAPGDRVADVGAGTGLFLEPLAEAVGPEGRVLAVDIAPNFVEHMRERAREAGWSWVEPMLCSERSVDLPPASVDLAFVCDTYHHFEYPRATLASLHAALRPGGRMVVVEFDRIPGVSRAWILEHVRAGRETFTDEIVAAGFRLVREIEIDGLEDNYVLEFARLP